MGPLASAVALSAVEKGFCVTDAALDGSCWDCCPGSAVFRCSFDLPSAEIEVSICISASFDLEAGVMAASCVFFSRVLPPSLVSNVLDALSGRTTLELGFVDSFPPMTDKF